MSLDRRLTKLEASLASTGVVTVLICAGETLDAARERHIADGGADPIAAPLCVWIDKPGTRISSTAPDQH